MSRKNTANSKYAEVAAQLREYIVGRELPPGQKLPPRRQLQKELNVSSITLQKAFDMLENEGFTSSRGNAGTYIARLPPHLYRVGMVFDCSEQFVKNSKFFALLADQAGVITEQTDYEFQIYYDVRGDEENEEATARFFEDIRSHRLCGVVGGRKISDWVKNFTHWPIWRETNIPRIMVQTESTHPEFPAIYPDFNDFVEQAVDTLVGLGVKNVGIVGITGLQGPSGERMRNLINEKGLFTPPYWQLKVHPCCWQGVKNAVHMMMHPQKRPKGLIVTDDTLVDFAGAGILAAGLSVPEDVIVVSEANFPITKRSIIPTIKVGFNVQILLEQAVKCLQNQRKTGRIESKTLKIPAEKMVEATDDDQHPAEHQVAAAGPFG